MRPQAMASPDIAARSAGFLTATQRQWLSGLVVGLMTTQVLGAISVILQFGIVLILFFDQWQAVLARLPRMWPLLAFPVIAVASTLWSDDPAVTLRYSLQLLFTFIAGIILAVGVAPRRLTNAIYVGGIIVAVLSIISGRQGASADGPVLVGLLGSKNQIAYLAQLLLAASALIVLDTSQSRLLRLSTVVAAPTAIMLLLGAHAATGILTAIGASALIFGLVVMRNFTPGGRVAAILGVVLLAAPAVMLKDEIVAQAQNIAQTVFKKDSTITGRTYLWRQADRLIAQRPLLGHGYHSVWLGSSVETTGLLRWANVTDPRGFNFHHTYREFTVDTGLLGVTCFGIGLLLIGWRLLRRYLFEADMPTIFFLTMYVTYTVRSFAETFVVPFGIATLLLSIFATFAFARDQRKP